MNHGCRSVRFVGLAAACIVGSTLAGTTTAAAPEPPGNELPAGVEVFAEFPRYLQVAGEEIEVAVDNDSDVDLWIAEVSVRVDGFAAAAPSTRATLVRAGRRIDVRSGLGVVDCAVEPARAEAILHVADGVGADPADAADAIEVVVEIDATPFVDIHADVCGAQDVLAAVDLSWSQTFRREGDAILTTLDATAQAGEAATIHEARGSVIFAVTPTATARPIGELAWQQPSLQIPVAIRVQRCDAHAVIESKKSFQLRLWVTAGGRDTQFLTVEPEGELRAALEALVQECLAGAG